MANGDIISTSDLAGRTSRSATASSSRWAATPASRRRTPSSARPGARLAAVLRPAQHGLRRQHRLRARRHRQRRLLGGADGRLRRQARHHHHARQTRCCRRSSSTTSRASRSRTTTRRRSRRPSSTACRCTASGTRRPLSSRRPSSRIVLLAELCRCTPVAGSGARRDHLDEPERRDRSRASRAPTCKSANFAATPHFVGPVTGQNGQYYTNDGQVQAPNYRPLQPYVSLPAARSDSPGLVAHGVVIDGAHEPGRPGDRAERLRAGQRQADAQHERRRAAADVHRRVVAGEDPERSSRSARTSNVNLVTGQFFTQTSGPSTTGVERKWTQIDGRVTYSTSQDFTPPTIDSINAFESDPGHADDVLAFSGQFSDLDPTNPTTDHPGTVVFAQVIYDDGTGHWHAVQLQQDSGLGPLVGGRALQRQPRPVLRRDLRRRRQLRLQLEQGQLLRRASRCRRRRSARR